MSPALSSSCSRLTELPDIVISAPSACFNAEAAELRGLAAIWSACVTAKYVWTRCKTSWKGRTSIARKPGVFTLARFCETAACLTDCHLACCEANPRRASGPMNNLRRSVSWSVSRGEILRQADSEASLDQSND